MHTDIKQRTVTAFYSCNISNKNIKGKETVARDSEYTQFRLISRLSGHAYSKRNDRFRIIANDNKV